MNIIHDNPSVKTSESIIEQLKNMKESNPLPRLNTNRSAQSFTNIASMKTV